MVRYGQACRLLGVLAISAVLRGGDSASIFAAAEKAAQTDEKVAVAAVDDDEDSPSAADARHWSGFSRALDGASDANANIIDAIASGDAGSLGLADADPLQGGTTRATNGNNDKDQGGRELYTPTYTDGGTRGYYQKAPVPAAQQQPWTYHPHPNQSPAVSCPYGGALQVPRVDGEVCLAPGEGICADGWTFFIGAYYDGTAYLMLWNDDDKYPSVRWFPGATRLCVGERYPNIAYLYVEYDEGSTCYLVGPNAGNPYKLPRLKIVPGSDDYRHNGPIVKFRDGAGDDDTILTIAADGDAETSPDARWVCTNNSAPPSISPAPSAPPSDTPTDVPSSSPSASPTAHPSDSPSATPTSEPSSEPSVGPTVSMRPSTGPTGAPSSIPSDSPSLAPSATPTVPPSAAPSAAPTGSPTAEPSAMPSAAPTTTCDRDNVGTFGELVDRIEAATGPTVKSIGVCPGMYTFTQDINFDLRRFELFCVSQSLCTFDLSGHSFTSGLGTNFSASFQGLTMLNGNGQNRTSSGSGQVPEKFDKTFGKTGGAILAFAAGEQSQLDIRDCGFFGNEALGGGAVAAFGNVDVTLDDVTFLQNAAITDPSSDSDFQGLGGAFLADDGVSSTGGPNSQLSVSVNGTRFKDNAALVAGGAIEFSPPRPMIITETEFLLNKAMNDGGAIASYEGNITMDEVTFIVNSAGYSGGAITYGPLATGSMRTALFRYNFNAIVGRPPSPDIHRLEENGNIASVMCGRADVVFCDATGNPDFVTTNFNNVTCAGATTGGSMCTTTRADDSPDGGSQLPPIDINRGEQEPTLAWSWPRTRISV